MAITRTIKSYFAVWNHHGLIVGEIYFGSDIWHSKKQFSFSRQNHA